MDSLRAADDEGDTDTRESLYSLLISKATIWKQSHEALMFMHANGIEKYTKTSSAVALPHQPEAPSDSTCTMHVLDLGPGPYDRRRVDFTTFSAAIDDDPILPDLCFPTHGMEQRSDLSPTFNPDLMFMEDTKYQRLYFDQNTSVPFMYNLMDFVGRYIVRATDLTI
jgi:hypothetical protein